MALWDSIGTTYVDAATTALPLHRAALFLAAFVGSVAVHKQTHLSIFESISNISLASFASLSSGALSGATLADVMTATAVCVGGWVYSRVALRSIFFMASRSTDLMTRIVAAQKQAPLDPQQALHERQKAVALVESSLIETRTRLKAMGAAAEFVGGVGLAALTAFYWGNVLDLTVGVAFCFAAFTLQVSTVRLFLSEYFGPALFKAHLQGKQPPSPTSLR